MVALRYGISLLMFNSIPHEWAQGTSETSRWTLKEKFHSPYTHVLFFIYCLLDFLQISWNIQFLASYDRNKLQRRSSSFQLGCGINSIIHCLWCQTPYDLGFTWRQFVRNESSLWQISCNASAELEIKKDIMHWF